MCIPRGELPREVGYVRLNSNKYNEWQVLAYDEGCDETLASKEKELYECWLAEQPRAVERRKYEKPDRILQRPTETSVASDETGLQEVGSVETVTDGWREAIPTVRDETSAAADDEIHNPAKACQRRTDHSDAGAYTQRDEVSRLLAFLPDLTEPSLSVLDYTGPNVVNESLSGDKQQNLVDVLKRHEKIMIASGNALPPPAYRVVCDIDVQGQAPIKQRARRTPLRVLEKLAWASSIGIVLKKNGDDIRLCIDYKRVNAVTTIMEYAMPVVDALLTDMEAYLWFCSLDAASGFWAVLMTERVQNVFAFVCTLGHFEWQRMPFGLKNAPMIYQRMMDNALWGFVQPKCGWTEFSERMRSAEEDAERAKTGVTEGLTRPRSKFEAERASASTMDPVSRLPIGDMFANGEPDESSLVPGFDRRSFLADICFGSESFDG
ncbi:LOW QUALITY PROTEIN: hypothetical protein PHMEG_00012286 [Phytophthora megakarya]|uniref:Reverse transcriptase domain-containing protein n=1 Tax=Phytophthora megakarya TaxID=4795 RepID=A0A225W9J6_9STRA|nr:LOW QUALITY PROTEIN: hypothetical protein PHMEG_00012286 [Phytophthora megakarya]